MKKVRKVATVVSFSSFLLFAFMGLAVPMGAQAQHGGAEPLPVQIAEPEGESGKGVLRSVGEATTDVSAAMKSGGREMVRQSSGLWHDIVVPMMSRFANALPSVVKAIVLLAAFWIVALLAPEQKRRFDALVGEVHLQVVRRVRRMC